MSTSGNNFNTIAGKKRRKKLPPFSLRLTFDERARLEELAGDEPLGGSRQSFSHALEERGLYLARGNAR